MALAGSMHLPVLKTGAMVVAWTAAQDAALPDILDTAHQNGVTGVRLLSACEILGQQPQLSPVARAAVLGPGEHVIDPWSPFHGYAQQVLAAGGTILRNTEVIFLYRTPEPRASS